jgi:hypothetical protein
VSAMERIRSVRECVAICGLLAVYFVGVFGGIIQRDSGKANKPCIFFLLAQIPALQTPAITYHLISLFSYAIAFSNYPASLTFSWFFGTDWELSLLHSVAQNQYGVNLFPIGMLILLRLYDPSKNATPEGGRENGLQNPNSEKSHG